MRRAQKQEILDCIDSLRQAHDEIKGALGRKNLASAQNMISECQDFAISLGENMERLEEEECTAVSYIEEYCEVLFHVFEDIRTGSINEHKAYKDLKKQLLKIENSVRNDITVRKEVVFFPYKASMWDSLESVYLAAKEDPNCDAYCVPIPYYELNPDHSFGQMHYEGTEYPENIEVIDWQKYNFEERKPDEIYIHNPYDNYNLVTSVHPRFYSGNLKKYTKKLVYVAYFILNEIEPDDQDSIDKIKHFIWLPGIINADKVIVQSEKMKQIYINEYIKASKENGWAGYHIDKKYLSKKIMGLGSPKVDKVLAARRENFEIPEEWMRIIRKADGGWKKIIFYNTAITALLEHNEKWLEKIDDSLGVFKKNRENIALLWRPHPLIENTLWSMRPHLLKKYLDIKERYIKEGWGIYDETADIDRAVTLSDAYYGDGSSVAYLFAATEKLVCYPKINMIQYDCSRIRFEGHVQYQDKIYVSAMDYNLLVEFDSKNLDVIRMFTFPENEWNQKQITQNIGMWKDKLWMLPFEGKKIFCFDLKKEEWQIFDMPDPWPKDYFRRAVFAGVQIGRYYYGFCYSRYGVIKLDMEWGQASYTRDGLKEYQEKIKKGDFICRQDCCVVGNNIYVAGTSGNIVLSYNCETEQIDVYEVGNDENCYSTICYDGACFWLTGSSAEIVCWDKEQGKIRNIPIETDGYIQAGQYNFASSLYEAGYVWLFADSANMNIRIDVQTGKVESFYKYGREYNEGYARVLKSWYLDGKIWFVDAETYSVVSIDEDCKVKAVPIRRNMDCAFLKHVWEDEENTTHTYDEKEGKYQCLDSFLKYISLKDGGDTSCYHEENRNIIGEKIYRCGNG